MEVILNFLAAQRSHDLGRSGWRAIVPSLAEIGVVGMMVARNYSLDDMQIGAGIQTLAILAATIVLGLIPGHDAPNKWGDPLPGGINCRNACRS